MRQLLRPALKIALALIVVFLIAAALTNPDKNDFNQKARSELNKRVQEATDNPVLGYIADLGLEFSNAVTEHLVHRSNYVVCSVYTVELPDGTYRYLGAFGGFLPLQNKDPFDQLN